MTAPESQDFATGGFVSNSQLNEMTDAVPSVIDNGTIVPDTDSLDRVKAKLDTPAPHVHTAADHNPSDRQHHVFGDNHTHEPR